MNPAIWANLFWKEWREHRWKLAALAAIAFGTFGIFLFSDKREVVATSLLLALMTYTPLATLFIGMGLAASEQARGTIGTLQGLSCSLTTVALVKLLVGLATVLLPAFSLLLIATTMNNFDETGLWRSTGGIIIEPIGLGWWQLDYGVVQILASFSLLVWGLSAAVNQPTELRAAVRGLMLIVSIWIAAFVLLMTVLPSFVSGMSNSGPGYFSRDFAEVAIVTVGICLPGGSVCCWALGEQAATWGIAAACYLTVHGLLVWRWLARYGQAVPAAKQVEAAAPPNKHVEWLAPPHRSPTRAILWKQARECLPLVGGHTVVVAGFVTCMMMIESTTSDLWARVWVVVWVTMVSGYIAAMLAGIGGFQDDLNPGFSAFWRSRPIDADRWFWLKYTGGILVLTIVFGGAYLLCWLIDIDESRQNSVYVIQFLLTFWLTYASAVLVACLVRNAIYAGILAFFLTGMIAAPTLAYESVIPLGLQAAILTASSLCFTLIAWQATRNNWGLAIE